MNKDIKKTATKKWELKNRVYKLTTEHKPLTFKLLCEDKPSPRTNKNRLLWFDEETQTQRALRYAINHKSPFKDEQDGPVVQEPVIFKHGFLTVPKENIALQRLLDVHPWNSENAGRRNLFTEVRPEVEAQKEVDAIKLKHKAVEAALDASLETCEAILRHYRGESVAIMDTEHLHREVIRFAEMDPQGFLKAIDNKLLLLINAAYRSIELGVCKLDDGGRTFAFSKPYKVLTKLPLGDDPYEAIAEYFTTDLGMEALNKITSKLKK